MSDEAGSCCGWNALWHGRGCLQSQFVVHFLPSKNSVRYDPFLHPVPHYLSKQLPYVDEMYNDVRRIRLLRRTNPTVALSRLVVAVVVVVGYLYGAIKTKVTMRLRDTHRAHNRNAG